MKQKMQFKINEERKKAKIIYVLAVVFLTLFISGLALVSPNIDPDLYSEIIMELLVQLIIASGVLTIGYFYDDKKHFDKAIDLAFICFVFSLWSALIGLALSLINFFCFYKRYPVIEESTEKTNTTEIITIDLTKDDE